jgi:hypothetical protein
MKIKISAVLALSLFAAVLSHGAATYTVSGYVVDRTTGETVIGVNVVVRDQWMGAVTDGNGFFRIGGLPAGRVVLDISHIAYQPAAVSVLIENKGLVLADVSLQPKTLEMKEMVITAQKSDLSDGRIDTGYRKMTPTAILSIPDQRKDVFRAVKYLPGIEGVDPISPLYSVRGGDPGENLVLLDGVTIYNPYHYVQASGLFNLYAIKNVEMLVGGFGAEFGGRNSSVLYITTREGNNEKLHGEIEPTITYTNAVFDFPVGRNATLMVSGRVYYDLITRFLMNSPSYFYDTNIALNWKLGSRNRLSLRYFHSKDMNDFQSADYLSYLGETFDTDVFDDYNFRFKTIWKNQAVTGILKTVISSRLYVKTQLSGSFFSSENVSLLDFRYTDPKTGETAKLFYLAEIQNRIQDISGKSVFSLTLGPSNTFSFGAEASRYGFDNDIRINQLSEGKTARNPDLVACFAEYRIGAGRLTFRTGLRFSKFGFMDSWYAEPRLSAALDLPREFRLKAAWGRTLQYITSVNSQEYELSQFLDYYYPLKNRDPSASTHTILGLEKKLSGNSSVSMDCYYKDISRVYAFDYNISEMEAFRFSDKLKAGTGRAYGVELLWQGTWRTFSGWISYGIGRSTRSYPHILNGRTFLFDYDRTHAFKAVITHRIHPALSYSGTLRILSGVPKTVGRTERSYYYYDPVSGGVSTYPVDYNETKNNARLPLFVQLDAGLKKRIRKGFGADLADFLGAKESYVNVTFSNLLFFLHRNVWFYLPLEQKKLYGLGTNYFPTFSTGYTIKF